MRRLMAAVLLAALAAVTSPLAQMADDSYRAEFTDAGEVRGPLSDFWFKVRSEWSGYLKVDEGPPEGGGFLQRRTMQSAAPNRVWVSLVFSDLSPDTYGRPLQHLYDEFLKEWKRAEGRNWPYAQIYARTWPKMGQIGRTQNIIMIGTPWALEPVGPLASSLGFTIAPGRIDIGKRKYRGDNLILIFIAPNPENREKYAMVITGSSDEALLQSGHLPYGETDYVLFRGRRLLESGHFDKKDPSVWSAPESYQARGTHHGFAIRESTHYTFWYEPDRMPREELESLVREKEDQFPQLAALAPPGAADGSRLTYYLYPTVDRKIDETARDDVSHVDFASTEIHTVFSPTQRVVEPYLDLMVMVHRSLGPTRVPRLERALAIALAPGFQGQDVTTLAGRIFEVSRARDSVVLKTLRDQDVMTPADGPPSANDLLLAGFIKDLITTDGREKAFAFVRQAAPRDLDVAFDAVYDRDMGEALHAWCAKVRRDAAPETIVAADAAPAPPDPHDTDVARARELLRQRRDSQAVDSALGHPA